MNLSLHSRFLAPGLPLSNDFRLELNYHSSSWQKTILTIGHEVLPALCLVFNKKAGCQMFEFIFYDSINQSFRLLIAASDHTKNTPSFPIFFPNTHFLSLQTLILLLFPIFEAGRKEFEIKHIFILNSREA